MPRLPEAVSKTAAQLRLLLGFSSALLSVTVHSGVKLGEMLALGKLGRELLLDKASQAGQQLAEGGLTEDELEKVKALGAKVKSSGAVATGARTGGAVSQADLDLQDGVCLAYLERMMKIWNGAHDRDPSIPQLLPIATRALFSPARKRVKEPTTEAAPVDDGGEITAKTEASGGKKPA